MELSNELKVERIRLSPVSYPHLLPVCRYRRNLYKSPFPVRSGAFATPHSDRECPAVCSTYRAGNSSYAPGCRHRSVISVKENISDGPEGIILESMLEGYAEYYSAELSEKIQRGQKENALKCKNNGGNTPLGYVVGTDGAVSYTHLDVYKRQAPMSRVRALRKNGCTYFQPDLSGYTG